MAWCWSRDGYLAACTLYKERWSLLDQTLYGLCQDNPSHSDIKVVNAKLWVVGRTFTTGIERKIKSDRTQGNALTRLASHMLKEQDRVQSLLTRLPSPDQGFTEQTLGSIVGLHGEFTSLLAPLLKKDEQSEPQTARSFVSKYMHFHSPRVPIYDSVARRALGRMHRWKKKDFEVLPKPAAADREYYEFCCRFWRLWDEMRTSCDNLSVRLVDHYLLWLDYTGGDNQAIIAALTSRGGESAAPE